MCFIGFLDPKNIGLDILFVIIGILGAELLIEMYFVAAILNVSILSGNQWSDVVVPAIFEFSTLKTLLGQIMVLSSGSAQLHQKMSHVRPTI